MSRFWNWVSNLSAGETARASEVDANLSAVNNAFGIVESEMNRSIRFTDGNPAVGDFQIADSPAQRAGKAIICDSSGKPAMKSVAFNFRGAWVAFATYSENDVVTQGLENSLYICTTAHSASSTFAADLSTKWKVLIDLTQFRKALRVSQIIDASASPYQASAGDDLMVDVSAGAVQITLPASPSLLDQAISVTHIGGPIASNNILIARNGKVIMGLAENMAVTDVNAAFELAFSNDVFGWRLVRGT